MRAFLRLIALTLAAALFQGGAAAQWPRGYDQAGLDRLLAPIALYPDSLLSQVLIAATRPLEVVEAARWSRLHPDLGGEEAVLAAADRDWDPAVKSLLAFPHLLARMDENLEWTRALGEAFRAQEPQVMQTAQRLRRRALAAGHLASDGLLHVAEEDGAIAIRPAQPGHVFLPWYNPWVVYGAWWWPAPPVYWAPWPGYVMIGLRPAWYWGPPVRVFAGVFFARCDWRARAVRVGPVGSVFIGRTVIVNRPAAAGAVPPRRQDDLRHRRAEWHAQRADRFPHAPHAREAPGAARREPGAAARGWHANARATERPVRAAQVRGRF